MSDEKNVVNLFEKRKESGKVNYTHVARPDLVCLAALYYRNIEHNEPMMKSLLHAFAEQAEGSAVIHLTYEQYKAFNKATERVVDTIETAYKEYLKEANDL